VPVHLENLVHQGLLVSLVTPEVKDELATLARQVPLAGREGVAERVTMDHRESPECKDLGVCLEREEFMEFLV
jgi:hypothetical protein